jgi:hypothetical protein
LQELDESQILLSILSVTPLFKALATKTLKEVMVSPMQLRAIAESIKNWPYVPGYNDCHTWFLIAFSKLEEYKVAKKKTAKEKTIGIIAEVVGCVSNFFFPDKRRKLRFLKW